MTKTAKAQSAERRARRVQRELFIPSFQSSPAESGFRLMPQHSILPFFHHSTLPTFLLHIQENLTGFANLVGFTTILHSSNLSLLNRRIATFFPPIAIGVPFFHSSTLPLFHSSIVELSNYRIITFLHSSTLPFFQSKKIDYE